MSKKKTLGELTTTARGFELIEFQDYDGHECSLQQSGAAVYEQPGAGAVWLGINDAKPKIMASQAAQFGVKTTETTGWVDYPIPDEVSLTTRMHLNREQVAALIVQLQNWLDEGEFKDS